MDKTAAKELELQQRIKAHLEDGKPAITLETENEDEEAWLQEYNLLTAKPVIFAANVSEDDLADDGASNPHVQAVRELAKEQNSGVFVICAEIEQEIAELEDDEKKMFLDDLGIQESGLEKLIKASYELLGLMSYLTAGEDETRAWTIKVGTKAPQAAGKIHTDFERGFIKAEVVNYKDLLESGSYAGAREKGAKIRIVYSPADAEKYALEHPEEQVVFLSVGFETTTPAECLSVKQAKKDELSNYSLLMANKTMPQAYEALKGSADVFLYPGHVNAITGTELCEHLTEEGVSGVVAGFTAKELLTALAVSLVKFQEGKPFFVNCYPRVVKPEGSREAQQLTEEMTEAMTDSMPLRALVSFGGYSREELTEIIEKLNKLV